MANHYKIHVPAQACENSQKLLKGKSAGRKTLLFWSAGFEIYPDIQSREYFSSVTTKVLLAHRVQNESEYWQ